LWSLGVPGTGLAGNDLVSAKILGVGWPVPGTLELWNSLKPFIWTAKTNDILEKVKRGQRALNNVQSV
jgi:hypothetical protein